MLTLTDGTQVRAELRGDAFMHFYQDAEGVRYTKVPESAYYQVADMDALARNAAKRITPVQASKAHRVRRFFPIGEPHTSPLQGTHKELIILVNFSNLSFEEGHDQALYNEMANTKDFVDMSLALYGSVRDYFEAQSGGLFKMDFDVVGPVTLSHPYRYYGVNDSQTNQDAAPEKMIIDAVKAVDASVDFSKYDNDGDGYVDQVFVLYAGLGESAGGDENTVWPHKFTISYTGTNNYRPLSVDGVKVDDYACSSELTWYGYEDMGGGQYSLITGISGIGVLCHEFSHCLGLPDVYDTAGENYGMNTYDIMDAGEWNGINAPGITPPEYTAYERMYLGWRQPIVLDSDTTIRGLKPISQDGETFIIYNKANKNEYYLLENRQFDGWDEALEGRGLLISHVDFNPLFWEYNLVNNTSSRYEYEGGYIGNTHQRLHLVAADNSFGTYKIDPVTYVEYYDYDDVMGDCYPYNSLDSLTNWSSPRANLYNNNSDGRKLLNVGITNIRQNADGTIDFDFRANAGSGSIESEVYFYESFNQCAGTGGNDGDWGSSASVASATLRTDNEGWSGTPSGGSAADKCAKFGASRGVSSALTPVFAINDVATLTFMAAPWQGDGTNMTVEVFNDEDLSNTITLSDTNFKMVAGQWTTFTTTITGTGRLQLRFKGDKRFFLDEVRVQTPGADAIECIKVPSTINPKPSPLNTFDISGRPASPQQKGIVIQEGKKLLYR